VGATEIKHDFLAYLLPKPEVEGAEQELEWVREYAYELRPKDIDTAGYFLNFHEGQVVYNEYASKIALTRKTFQNVMATRPSRITISRRELEEEEVNARKIEKEKVSYLLLPPQAVLALTHQAVAEE
jgi:hypothetical protein